MNKTLNDNKLYIYKCFKQNKLVKNKKYLIKVK